MIFFYRYVNPILVSQDYKNSLTQFLISLDKFRGFCYLKFDDPETYRKILEVPEHFIDNKKVIVQIALTKEESFELLKDEKNRK